jgi:hypothetical protein
MTTKAWYEKVTGPDGAQWWGWISSSEPGSPGPQLGEPIAIHTMAGTVHWRTVGTVRCVRDNTKRAVHAGLFVDSTPVKPEARGTEPTRPEHPSDCHLYHPECKAKREAERAAKRAAFDARQGRAR